MNNKELQTRVKEILNISNYFEMILEAKEFEKEYKNSDFFKQTKMPLEKILKEAKIFYFLQFDDFFDILQVKIDTLDLSRITELLDNMTNIYHEENLKNLEVIENFKDIIK